MAENSTEPHLVRYISSKDIDIAIKRVPEEYRSRVREITTWHTSEGVRKLGYVTKRGRRDINLCTWLPPRVSLGRYLRKSQSAKEFGAPVRGQWTPWAVRRFMLYDVLLHELGHLQVVNAKSKSMRRKFADEKIAQDFAEEWKRKLFSTYFDHPDIIHNPPTDEELAFISVWERLNKKQRFVLVNLVLNAPYSELPDGSLFGEINDLHISFLNRALCYLQ